MKPRIHARALELGFAACRFTTPGAPASAPQFAAWLDAGRHGEMHYLARNRSKRVDPQLVLPGARSVIVLAANYGPGQPREDLAISPARAQVARYACHADYHEVLAPRLKQLAAFVDELGGTGTRSLWYADTGPVLERDLAQRAGLGFIGKHTNLISRELGNWFLLGEILTTLELEPDPAERNRCGTCDRCLRACPTEAITAPFQLDARRCISYLTIELKGAIPVEFRRAIGGRVFGCDDCLAVCPWNRFAREAGPLREHYREDLARPAIRDWLDLGEPEFRARFADTPLARVKRRGLLRNVCVALGNVGDEADLPGLAKTASDPEPLIAEHAAWATQEILRRHQRTSQ